MGDKPSENSNQNSIFTQKQTNNRITIPKGKIRSYFPIPAVEYKSPIKNATVKQLCGVLVQGKSLHTQTITYRISPIISSHMEDR